MSSSRLSAITPKLPKGVLIEKVSAGRVATPLSLAGGTASPNFCTPDAENCTPNGRQPSFFGAGAVGVGPMVTSGVPELCASPAVAAAARWHQDYEAEQPRPEFTGQLPVLLGRSNVASGPPTRDSSQDSSAIRLDSSSSQEVGVASGPSSPDEDLALQARFWAKRTREAFLARKQRVESRNLE